MAIGKLTLPLIVFPVIVAGPWSRLGSLNDQTLAPMPIPRLNIFWPTILLLDTVTPE